MLNVAPIEKFEIEERMTQFLPSQRAFVFAPERFSAIAGGYACVAAETIVNGIPIAERSSQHVSTLFGPFRPSNPFLKGRSDLYEVLSHSGSRVVVTAAHRFLTPSGWRQLSSLRVGAFVAGDDISSVRSAMEKCKGSRGCNFADSRQNDLPLHPALVAYLDKSRLLHTINDDSNALADIYPFLYTSHFLLHLPHEDDEQCQGLVVSSGQPLAALDWNAKCPHRNPLFPGMFPLQDIEKQLRPLANDAWFREDAHELAEFLSKEVSSVLVREGFQEFWQPDHSVRIANTSEQSFLLSQQNYSTFWDQIAEIKFVRHGDFYDLSVPGAEHYSAQGFWHHNSGKTRAGVTKGLILSAIYPGNVGMILRYRGTDLEESTIPVFFEVCPPSWIKSFNKKAMTIVLRNGSVIMFRHLHDAKAQSKTRRVGANLGWFFIDQMEEIEREHWNAMISRLRLPRVPKKFGFGALNPAGHDWNWEDFFPAFKPWEKDKKGHALPMNGKFFQAIRPSEDVVGIAVNSEENKIGNGGFVEDKYFESLLNSYGQEYIDRYVYCTFDDFQGKIYKSFVAGFKNEDYSSVHNISPFPIPKHWPLTVGIDVGGDSPWAVIPEYTDDNGNQVVVDGFVKRTAHSGEIVRWIKTHLPWQEDRTTFVIDWENRVAMMDLAEQGIHCQIARKDVKPGIIRTQGYFHVNPVRRLPEWYEETQDPRRFARFRFTGSPRTFVFNTFKEFRAEHDKYHWDQNKMETPFKSALERFDTCDAHRYVIMTKPEPVAWSGEERDYDAVAKIDPLSFREMNQLDKRIREREWRRKGGAALREADLDEVQEIPDRGDGKYDWSGSGEV